MKGVTPRTERTDLTDEGGTVCILALGSNLGDRRQHLTQGVSRLLSSGVVLLEAISRVVESEAWGPVPQGPYLNMLVRGRTGVGAMDLLKVLQRIEADEGRERVLRYGPRTLDMDIVFYGDLVLNTASLTLPHPKWRERAFVHDLLGDVVRSDDREIFSLSGVPDALLPGRPLSTELQEVGPIHLAALRDVEREGR